MPFRARFKKAFGRSSSSSSSSGNTTPSGLPIEFYKPGEVPRSKYRGPWNQQHQDKLSSFQFSFGRKASFQGSEYSPAQSRSQSRRSSWIGRRPSTRGSTSGKSAKGPSDRAPSRIGQVAEGSDEDNDITNVGVSRRQTREKRGANFGTYEADQDGTGAELEQQVTLTIPPHEHDTPFTEAELTKALTEATLRPPRSAGHI